MAATPDLDQQCLTFMCRHLVSLCGDYRLLRNGRPEGDPKPFTLSGFVMQVGESWCYATAGHILHDEGSLGDAIRKGQITVDWWGLADFFGPNAIKEKVPTPFDFDLNTVGYVHSPADSLDFALIPLSAFFFRSLMGNGVVPLPKVNWEGSDKPNYVFHALVGLPEQPNPASFRPTLVPVRHITQVPAGVIPPAPDWFLGQINSPISIVGMSGGPIFGFYQNPEGQWLYKVVAIQSGWFSKVQVILGCPIPRFMALVDAELERPGKEGQ